MYRSIVVVLFVIFNVFILNSQELKCTVSINSDRATTANKQVIQTLRRSLNDFINKTQWTKQEVLSEEVINCSMFINISNVSNNNYTASIQVQSSRTAFGSAYESPIFNFNDGSFNFEYTEFQNLFFDPNSSNSNLVAVVSFYVHMILAFDADSFSLEGGSAYYQTAKTIADLSQQNGYAGWSPSDGNQSRFALINDILKSANKNYRNTLYLYHLKGMDMMSEQKVTAKENIVGSLLKLEELYKGNSGVFLLRIFFDAKADEVFKVFKDGPSVELKPIKKLLNKLSPQNTVKWSKL